ncbi:MAG TPA: TssQ family T6SS-associated lipoprotein [Burkholderiales bacterium]|nr:TssQ family T6SS-associated lipoprotein [Burkholderiales bacterium]
MNNKKLPTAIALAFLVTVAACSPSPLQQAGDKLEALVHAFTSAVAPSATHSSAAQSMLADAVNLYEEGEYADSAAGFHGALNLGLNPGEQASAHKYLGFIYCTADLEPACRREFRQALRADPAMDLDLAEAGHPQWGPVFQMVRAQR